MQDCTFIGDLNAGGLGERPRTLVTPLQPLLENVNKLVCFCSKIFHFVRIETLMPSLINRNSKVKNMNGYNIECFICSYKAIQLCNCYVMNQTVAKSEKY